MEKREKVLPPDIQRLVEAREMLKLGQAEVAEALEMPQSALSKIESGTQNVPLKLLLFYNRIHGISSEWLLNGELPIRKGDRNEGGGKINSADSLTYDEYDVINDPMTVVHDTGNVYRPVRQLVVPVNTMPRVVVLDKAGNELVTHVPYKARAGYLSGHGDPEFINSLPAYDMPFLNNGTFRSFDVHGFSMLQREGKGLTDTDIVYARAVEHFSEIKDGRVYVIIAESDLVPQHEHGIIIKRCFNRLASEDPKIICNSDNLDPQYPPISIEPEQIREVWEYKGHLTRQLPGPSAFLRELNDLQAKTTILYEEHLRRLKMGEGAKKIA